jgi:hypothetical protein
MKKNILVLTLLAFSMGMFIPVSSVAASADPQIRVQIGKRHRHRDRGRHRGWYNGRRAYYYTYDPHDTRYIRRSYYNNGRRVIRWYWNY